PVTRRPGKRSQAAKLQPRVPSFACPLRPPDTSAHSIAPIYSPPLQGSPAVQLPDAAGVRGLRNLTADASSGRGENLTAQPRSPWRRSGGSARPSLHRRSDGGRTLVTVRLQRQVVDYALRRRSLLAEVYSGRTGVSEVCDANPYLLRAAKYHGKPSSVMCPICRKEQLTLVSWVFGDHLGAVSGSARTTEELVMLAARYDEFSV